MERTKTGAFADMLKNNAVPIFFTVLCIISIYYSGQSIAFVLTETISRVGRNAILILSLLMPVLCGMGLNFSIVLGAMAGEIGLILITHWSIDGLPGIFLAMLIGTVFSVIFGALTGNLFNKTKGQEMITGMILGFFAVGVFDLVFIYLVGTVIPMSNPEIMLPDGIGLRNTIDFHAETKQVVDKFIRMPMDRCVLILLVAFVLVAAAVILYKKVKQQSSVKEALVAARKFIIGAAIVGVIQVAMMVSEKFRFALAFTQVPVFTGILIVIVCFLTVFLTRTKLGQDIRTVGQNMHVATSSGINVNRVRIISVIISTVIASWGQVIFLQNMGNVNTYNSHEQVGTYAVAALLVGGASISKATMGQVFTGTILFHILFFTTPLAGKTLMGDAMIGEYFRVFLCYGVIAVSLALYAWRKSRDEQRQLEEESRA